MSAQRDAEATTDSRLKRVFFSLSWFRRGQLELGKAKQVPGRCRLLLPELLPRLPARGAQALHVSYSLLQHRQHPSVAERVPHPLLQSPPTAAGCVANQQMRFYLYKQEMRCLPTGAWHRLHAPAGRHRSQDAWASPGHHLSLQRAHATEHGNAQRHSVTLHMHMQPDHTHLLPLSALPL